MILGIQKEYAVQPTRFEDPRCVKIDQPGNFVNSQIYAPVLPKNLGSNSASKFGYTLRPEPDKKLIKNSFMRNRLAIPSTISSHCGLQRI